MALLRIGKKYGNTQLTIDMIRIDTFVIRENGRDVFDVIRRYENQSFECFCSTNGAWVLYSKFPFNREKSIDLAS